MKIHEYQAKELLAKFGIPVPRGIPVLQQGKTEDAAKSLMEATQNQRVVIKAQIHAGGRGKGGGIKVVQGLKAVRAAEDALFGLPLITHQTGPKGQIVKRLLVEEGLSIAQELYAGILLDRARSRLVVIASPAGGMDIEEVAATAPDRILKAYVDPVVGLLPFQARKLVFSLGLKEQVAKNAIQVFLRLYEVAIALDTTLVEINPLVITNDDRVMALDCKMTFDDNALERHPEIARMRDCDEEEPGETLAKEHDLNYIKLDGSIGCMVNGAGLAMATMDIIKHFGGNPANFLDVGGGATQAKVATAFKILSSDPHVKGIFVNIFGGIMKCDVIAAGILAAVAEMGLGVPLVVRLAGTNVELGTKLLAESGLAIQTAATMAEGAELIVAKAMGRGN